jgi:hypothetical protein
MGTRSRNKRWRRFERWQVLLASVVAALATVVVALISLVPRGSPAGIDATVPQVSIPSASASPVSIAITGLLEQPHPPPPGRLYVWTGTVRGLPDYASVFVIDKRPGGWLVSPAAVISGNGRWTVTWAISTPPASARWIAVVFLYGAPLPCCGLNSQGPSAPGVLAVATYYPRIRPVIGEVSS